MVNRIYVEKKPGLRHTAEQLLTDIRDNLLIDSLEDIRLFNRYDVEGIEQDSFDRAVRLVLSEPQLDDCFSELPKDDCSVLAVEYLPGQYDQRADSAEQCIQILTQGERPRVRTARVYYLYGKLSHDEINQIKHYLINPVEAREASLESYETLDMGFTAPGEVEILKGFITLDRTELEELRHKLGLAMDIDDLEFCRQYFASESREPSITEIRMIDTYWSDHCRHTTFLTTIDNVEFADDGMKRAWERYLDARKQIGRSKPINLMDIGTIAAKVLKQEGRLQGLDESEEINACTVKIKAMADGKPEDWLLLFKNETHNHPTEIEPFGGAATCIGGAIRDPLSGRAYVYQAMRVSGAADPTAAVADTIPGKLPQKKLVRTAADGYSSYGNQIGLATGLVEEIYHPGYMAKRMELGAVIAAAPAKNVRREKPSPGDVVILLGGRTGRDGVGGATGSSKAHNVDSLDSCGAEVQKGNAPEERKLQRLFRNPEASVLIKRCNDFGAGGVAVAIGELADGIDIDLSKVPKKYEGLDGTELAISESQERMAVVVAPEDEERFLQLAACENLEATRVATVTDKNRLNMSWNGKLILSLSRDFLNSNGAEKHISIETPEREQYDKPVDGGFSENMLRLSRDLNVVSQRGLSERFDSTIGGGTILMPFGGRHQRTPIQAMVARISMEEKHTDTVSVMAYGYNPFLSEKDQYRGAYLAVVESVSKLIAAGAGFKEVYLSLQEYFGKPGQDRKRWGAPLLSMLGALDAQLDLGIAAIGGKDSMSGSFEELDVPPTLVSFAVSCDEEKHIISPEYKASGNRVLWLRPSYENGLPKSKSLLSLYDYVYRLNTEGMLSSIYTPGYGGIAEAVLKQCMGNGFGFSLAPSLSLQDIFGYCYGSFLIELKDNRDVDRVYRDAEAYNEIIVADLGTVEEKQSISYNAEALELSALLRNYEDRLERVFPCNDIASDNAPKLIEIKEEETGLWRAPGISCSKPRVLIPVFPGNNCEYDSARAARDAGLEAEIVVVRNLSRNDIQASVQEVAKKLRSAQLLFVPGGFSGGDEPDGSAKFITSFFRNELMRKETMNLLERRDGLILGICNGFQALIKLGLVPFGEIIDTDADCPTLSFNTIGRHQSKIVETRVASNMSPWLMNTSVGEVYSTAISHGEGRFLCSEELFRRLAENGQIATQYADPNGKATMELQYNPNGSYYAVEGICSPDGRVLGKMGHVERWQQGNFKNVPGNYDMKLFISAKEYFEV